MNSLAFSSHKTSAHLQNFLSIYARFDANTLNQLPTIYHQEALFKDPIHELRGLDNITQYFQKMLNSLLACDFEYVKAVEQNNVASIFWTMRFCHKKLNSGNEIVVDGASFLEFREDKVIHHVDYYDLGAMLYEHIPVVGGFTKIVRNRLARD